MSCCQPPRLPEPDPEQHPPVTPGWWAAVIAFAAGLLAVAGWWAVDRWLGL